LCGERYSWEVTLDSAGKPYAHFRAPEEASRRVSSDESSVYIWTMTQPNDPDTPRSPPPLCLLFPMKGRSGIIGHVFVQRPRFYPVPATVQRYLALLATHAGLVWDNLQVSALRGTLQMFERELHLARQIQIELFPATFDLDERLSAFAVNLPTVQVSGDYYDIFRTGPHTIAFVIADAMGHGVPAALMMAAVRASLRMGLMVGLSWAAIFKGLDDIIAQARTDALVTGLIGQIDLQSRELHLVSAGHLPPSILVDGRPVPVPTQCQTRPWGLNFDSPWEVGRLSLAGEHWSILCFTDGITDVSVHPSRLFGARRVAAYHLEHHHHSAEDLCMGLLSEVATLQRTESLPDDQTLLVLRCGCEVKP
jgi:sigma-B regulation protein RsbU (phosphoserine phosphatase)